MSSIFYKIAISNEGCSGSENISATFLFVHLQFPLSIYVPVNTEREKG